MIPDTDEPSNEPAANVLPTGPSLLRAPRPQRCRSQAVGVDVRCRLFTGLVKGPSLPLYPEQLNTSSAHRSPHFLFMKVEE